jgi:apolipoprotein N-acyltransferase
MAGLSFLIYWVNMAIFSFIVDEHNRLKKLMLPAIVLLVVLTFGALRYDLGKAKRQHHDQSCSNRHRLQGRYRRITY